MIHIINKGQQAMAHEPTLTTVCFLNKVFIETPSCPFIYALAKAPAYKALSIYICPFQEDLCTVLKIPRICFNQI